MLPKINDKKEPAPKPSILAPAGNKASFLAAIAAGTDAVYCGLKQFSARMEAKNFTLKDLVPLTDLAHEKGVEVYLALNTLVKPGEIKEAGRLVDQINRWVKPDGLIIQDLCFVELARQVGFSGKLHLSTLANVGFPAALKLVRKNLGINRVVIPRELNIDEIKIMAQACPENLDLEIFVHGALCYGVSGRCYWSSYLGGKSGLRGRCVQPCRRLYHQKNHTARFFSCMDLSLDVLTKVLLSIPKVRSWKIEGRKKGPHYVYYTVKAYQILRDYISKEGGKDPSMKKTALDLLAQSLGRKGTHYNFLPQRPQNPVCTDGQTGSGLLVGKIQGARQNPYLIPRIELLPGDVLRIGYEDESWHGIYRVTRYAPKKGRLHLKLSSKKGPGKGTAVFLLDRREKELKKMLSGLEDDLVLVTKASMLKPGIPPSTFNAEPPKKPRKKRRGFDLYIYRNLIKTAPRVQAGLWLSFDVRRKIEGSLKSGLWWWLPPVIWPEEEKQLQRIVNLALEKGVKNFVLNAPWQMAFFPAQKGLNIWAGPFCNISNPLAIEMLASLGICGVIVSPELGHEDYMLLPEKSSLPLGIIVSGNWPLCISRIIDKGKVKEKDAGKNFDKKFSPGVLFASPRGEEGWASRYKSDYWIYPNWALDITAKKDELQKAGYTMFVHLEEPVPKKVKLKKRPGLWNWDTGLI